MKLPVIKPLYMLLRWLGAPVIWEKSVGAVLFRETGIKREYLLLRYPSGHYEFPRGHAEEGETEEETLRREVEEETGVKEMEIYPFRTENRFFYVAHGSEKARREREKRGIWIFKRAFFYPAQTTEEEIQLSHEHREWLWLPFAEALEKVTFTNARKVLERSEDYLQKKRKAEER
ncbi:MAG: NUDIX domain-containing protein [Candidatus Moranbacteria bacterium]|nr:NUDIX domain-containing protein [Candidatus Moranbacteria bacterium]MBP9801743.1 NUDIX domain-containing protein [Candidatus Moranbacteria bacterium]